MTPFNKWKEGLETWEPRLLPPHSVLEELTGQIEERVLDCGVIRIFGLRYTSADLIRFYDKNRIKKVMKVRFDPADISYIYVINYETGETFKAFTQGRLTREYTAGISQHVHRVIRLHALRGRETNDEKALRVNELMDAKNELMKIADSMLSKKKSKGLMQSAARFLEGLENMCAQADPQKYEDCGLVEDEVEYSLSDTSRSTGARRDNTPNIQTSTHRPSPEMTRTDALSRAPTDADIRGFVDSDFDLEID